MNYEEKAPDYFSNIRKDLTNLIKPNSKDLKISIEVDLKNNPYGF